MLFGATASRTADDADIPPVLEKYAVEQALAEEPTDAVSTVEPVAYNGGVGGSFSFTPCESLAASSKRSSRR